jgi:hypothetical protein
MVTPRASSAGRNGGTGAQPFADRAGRNRTARLRFRSALTTQKEPPALLARRLTSRYLSESRQIASHDGAGFLPTAMYSPAVFIGAAAAFQPARDRAMHQQNWGSIMRPIVSHGAISTTAVNPGVSGVVGPAQPTLDTPFGPFVVPLAIKNKWDSLATQMVPGGESVQAYLGWPLRLLDFGSGGGAVHFERGMIIFRRDGSCYTRGPSLFNPRAGIWARRASASAHEST